MGGKSSKTRPPDQPLNGILKKTLVGHKDSVLGCSFSPDGKYLSSCGSDRRVYIWDMKNMTCLKKFEPHKTEVNAVSFSPDSTTLLTCSKESKISIWDVKSLQRLYSTRMMNGSVTHCTFAKDSNKFFAACTIEGTVAIFEKQGDNISKKVVHAHHGAAFQVCFSPDCIHLASCGNDKKIVLWNRNTAKKTAKIKDNYSRILTCQFNPLGTLIAGVVDGEKVRIWSSVTLEVVCVLEDHHFAPIVCCTFSPDGKIIATGSGDKTIALWNHSEPHPMPVFHMKAHDNWVQTVAFSPNGDYLVTGSMDRKVNVWT